MVYRRLALIATLLAVLASGCGTSQESESPAPPGGTTTVRTPTAAPTPDHTTSATPATVVELPLGESSKEVVEFFFSDPETVARAVLAAGFDTSASDSILDLWVNSLEPVIAVSPTIYQIYTWANYPVGTYPHVEQFMLEFLKYPQGYGHAAEQWLDSDTCMWPEEVQEQVVAVERSSPGSLRASIVQSTAEAWAAEPAIRAITIGARGQFYDDREAYLDQFRCTSEGGGTANRTQIAWPTVPTQVATATSIPAPAPSPTPVVEILDNPREPTLVREILVSYLAEKLQEEASSANVQNVANRLAYLTGSAPLVLRMYIAAGYSFALEDEPVFYFAFLVHPGCVVSHPGLSEDQTTAFAEDFSRRWPDVDPNTAVGLAEMEQLTDGQKLEFCRQYNDWIETKKPT